MPFFHVWFATKQRKWLLQGEIQVRAKQLFSEIALEKGMVLLEHETLVDHVHIPNKVELPTAMKLLKGRSAFELFREFPELKLDASINSFWQRGYALRIVPEGEVGIVRRYIRTQDERLGKYER